MQSQAQTVDDYLKEIPAGRLDALKKRRRLCKQHLKGFRESMVYGMPCYSRDGAVEVAFASQKNNLALYILRKDVLDAHRRLFPPSSIGKGCIRYRNPEKIDYIVVESLLMSTCDSTGEIC